MIALMREIKIPVGCKNLIRMKIKYKLNENQSLQTFGVAGFK